MSNQRGTVEIDEEIVLDEAYIRDDMHTVIFSPKVRYVGARAFYGCTLLHKVVFQGESVELGAECFAHTFLREMTLPVIRHIPYKCFEGSGGVELTLPEGVVSIDGSAFRNSHFDNVVLPKSLKAIGTRAFESSTFHVDELDLSNVEALGEMAFSHCQIRSLILGGAHANVPLKCFQGCDVRKAEIKKNANGLRVVLGPECLSGNPSMRIKLDMDQVNIHPIAFFLPSLEAKKNPYERMVLSIPQSQRDRFKETDSDYPVYQDRKRHLIRIEKMDWRDD